MGEVAVIKRWDVVPFVAGDGIEVNAAQGALFRHMTRMPAGKLRLMADDALDFALFREEAAPGALRLAWQKLKAGGRLIVWVAIANAPNVPAALGGAGWDWIEHLEEDEQVLQVFMKRADGSQREAFFEVPGKMAAVVRPGGFGDALWASPVCAALKEQGYHVTVYTGAWGEEALRHDPHIDRFAPDGLAIVGRAEIGEYWAHEEEKYDRFVNLSHAVEGTMLVWSDSIQSRWPHELRHRLMNRNYMEQIHDVAELPLDRRQRFYPAAEEVSAALELIGGADPVIALADSGTHCNKWWPYMGDLARQLVDAHPDALVLVLGGVRSRFPDHPRIRIVGTTKSFREAAALALQADVVAGQETGLLNAVAMEPMKKVVLLTHSSAENLTKHWRNTAALSNGVACHPCHILHRDWLLCRRDERTQAAACQTGISRETVFNEIVNGLAPA